MSNHLLYHLHRQNRLLKLRKPFFPSKWVKLLNRVAMTVAILGPIATLPQAYKIWSLQNATGLSLISWGSCLAFNFPMLLYGIVHREKIMVRMYILWILVNGAVVLGIVLFG